MLSLATDWRWDLCPSGFGYSLAVVDVAGLVQWEHWYATEAEAQQFADQLDAELAALILPRRS